MEANRQSFDGIIETIRDNRSSEANFATLCNTLNQAIEIASAENDTPLALALTEVKETYPPAYEKAKERGGTAWPEFEKFVTQFERALSSAS